MLDKHLAQQRASTPANLARSYLCHSGSAFESQRSTLTCIVKITPYPSPTPVRIHKGPSLNRRPDESFSSIRGRTPTKCPTLLRSALSAKRRLGSQDPEATAYRKGSRTARPAGGDGVSEVWHPFSLSSLRLTVFLKTPKKRLTDVGQPSNLRKVLISEPQEPPIAGASGCLKTTQ